MPLDLLAAVAHPDDAELLAGGTLAKAVDAGRRVGILDLTHGEMGSRGNAEIRARESAAASLVLGITARTNAGLPDGHLQNNDAMRRVMVGTSVSTPSNPRAFHIIIRRPREWAISAVKRL